MLMNEYETTLILRPQLTGDAIEGAVDKVKTVVADGGGKLLEVNHWGTKRLAYDIAKNSRGTFLQAQYLGQGDLISELERNLRIAPEVMRYMTVRVGTNVNPDDREVVPYVSPSYDAPEADVSAPAATDDARQEEAKPSEEMSSSESVDDGEIGDKSVAATESEPKAES